MKRRAKPLTMREQLERANAWAQLATKEAALANERISAMQRQLAEIVLALCPERRVLSRLPDDFEVRPIHREGKHQRSAS